MDAEAREIARSLGVEVGVGCVEVEPRLPRGVVVLACYPVPLSDGLVTFYLADDGSMVRVSLAVAECRGGACRVEPDRWVSAPLGALVAAGYLKPLQAVADRHGD